MYNTCVIFGIHENLFYRFPMGCFKGIRTLGRSMHRCVYNIKVEDKD